MENTFQGSPENVQQASDRLQADFQSGAKRLRGTAASELQNLIADVEDLIGRISNLKDADVARVRGKVEQALASAKETINSGTDSVRQQARRVASTTDGYVRENPWQALGIAALVGVAIGFLVTRRS
jgi:ElaB/YqjD/DUF883 family membrane-anchored ribosome-binding protein